MGAFDRGQTRALAAVHAEDVDVIIEGYAPGDDPAVGPLAVLLDQREHLKNNKFDDLI